MIQTVNIPSNSDLANLDLGERAAIVLALVTKADLIVIDDLLGRQVAKMRQLRVTGLLGILDEAARQNLVDFPEAIALSTTNLISSLIAVNSVTFAAALLVKTKYDGNEF